MLDQGYVLSEAQQRQVSVDMEQYFADFDAMLAMWDDIVTEHEGKWIAFADGRVQAAGDSAESTREQLPEGLRQRAVLQHALKNASYCF